MLVVLVLMEEEVEEEDSGQYRTDSPLLRSPPERGAQDILQWLWSRVQEARIGSSDCQMSLNTQEVGHGTLK